MLQSAWFLMHSKRMRIRITVLRERTEDISVFNREVENIYRNTPGDNQSSRRRIFSKGEFASGICF